MWAARDFNGRPGWSSRRGMVGWSTGQPCLEGGFNPFVMDTPRMRSPFALLTPGVRRILNQSRVSSSARAVVMMSKMGTRRMAALCWGGGSPRSWVGLAERFWEQRFANAVDCETRELLVERGCVRLVAALRVFLPRNPFCDDLSSATRYISARYILRVG
jgi:hypothetical protein